MKAKIIIIVCLSLFFISAISNHLFQNVKSQNAVNKKLITVCPSPTPTPNNFPSYHEDFPFDETFCAKGEKPFELSQDYPLSFTSEKLRWTKIVKKKSDFKTKWREYLMAVLNYGYEGNLEENFEVQKNRVRNWYHAPWMHYGATGREFVHGLTRERRACLEVLLGAKKCFDEKNRTIQNWAVSFYNAPGGFYIGKVWREMYNPELDIKRPNKHPDAANFPKEGFPEGTVVIKLIFTDAINQPIVKGSVTWNAHINELKENNEINADKRKLSEMRLFQIDVAVREREDIAPTGWIYGSFVYNVNNTALMNYSPTKPIDSGWLKMTPIGLTIGNNESESFKEVDSKLPFAQHFGCNQYLKNVELVEGADRLNGPIDNPIFSCISCHAAAEVKQHIAFSNFFETYSSPCENERDNQFWFKNINPRSDRAFIRTLSGTEKDFSLDTSLQLRNGIDHCCQARIKGDTIRGCVCDSTTVNKKTEVQR